eukprot:6198702-Pleurochrysis_carterae.AAC.1
MVACTSGREERVARRRCVKGEGAARDAARGDRSSSRTRAPALEGQLSVEHDEGEHAERPQIDRLAVPVPGEQLGRAVARRAAARRVPPLLHRAQAEIRQLHVQIVRERGVEDVLGLNVAVDDREIVQVLNCLGHLFAGEEGKGSVSLANFHAVSTGMLSLPRRRVARHLRSG